MLELSDLVAFAGATDLDRARVFYEQTLGLAVVEQNDFACVLDANGTMLRVTAVPKVSPAGYTVLGWRVTDIAAAVASRSSSTTPWTRMTAACGPPPGATKSPGSAIPTAIRCR
jgi:hypothetical protein